MDEGILHEDIGRAKDKIHWICERLRNRTTVKKPSDKEFLITN